MTGRYDCFVASTEFLIRSLLSVQFVRKWPALSSGGAQSSQDKVCWFPVSSVCRGPGSPTSGESEQILNSQQSLQIIKSRLLSKHCYHGHSLSELQRTRRSFEFEERKQVGERRGGSGETITTGSSQHNRGLH